MVKSCNEIAKEIENLRFEIKTNKAVNVILDDLVEKQKCDSPSARIMCNYCNCWKLVKDKYD